MGVARTASENAFVQEAVNAGLRQKRAAPAPESAAGEVAAKAKVRRVRVVHDDSESCPRCGREYLPGVVECFNMRW